MDNGNLIAALWIGLALVASLVSIRFGISLALVEIGVGVVGGNIPGLTTTPWIGFLAALGAILLTFLAGAEIEPDALHRRASTRAPGDPWSLDSADASPDLDNRPVLPAR